ncbi:MAG: hypothetical protein ABI683_05820 [Ginsengibacter sp.]
MKNRINSILTLSSILIASTLMFSSCTKDKIITPNTTASLFASTEGSYFITSDPNTSYKIPLGITRVPDKSITIEFTVSSPSGAVEGQQYMLSSHTITIPANETVDSVTLNGIFSAYTSGRRDTLVFTITGGDVPSLVGSDVYTLVLQAYCDVDLDSFVGTYLNCFDDGSYGPYEIDILSAGSTGATTGYIMIENLWDAGGSTPVRVNLDWTDPANFTTTITAGQPLYIDSRYGQASLRPNGSGVFSACDNTFTLNYEVYVSAGSFGNTSTTMAR